MLHIFAIAQLRQTVLERGQVLADAIAPVGTVEERWFNVGPEVAFVSARAVIGENTLALVLTDPDGISTARRSRCPCLATPSAPAHRRTGQAGRVEDHRARHRFTVGYRRRSGQRHQRLRRAGHGRR